jgi:hypothetical protein
MATSDRFLSLALPLDYSKKAIWRAAAPLLTGLKRKWSVNKSIMLAYQAFYIKVYPDERDNPRRYAPKIRQMV